MLVHFKLPALLSDSVAGLGLSLFGSSEDPNMYFHHTAHWYNHIYGVQAVVCTQQAVPTSRAEGYFTVLLYLLRELKVEVVVEMGLGPAKLKVLCLCSQ